jgi:hypothetical protein
MLKQMRVMTEKGLLIRNERSRSHVYEAGIWQRWKRNRLPRKIWPKSGVH